jgi:hypothetical protein
MDITPGTGVTHGDPSIKSHDLELLRKISPHGTTKLLAWPTLATTTKIPCMQPVKALLLCSK